MTPKEKANNLLKEYKKQVFLSFLAKRIALKICNECLYLLDTQCEGYQKKMLDFWNKVKLEIKTS